MLKYHGPLLLFSAFATHAIPRKNACLPWQIDIGAWDHGSKVALRY
jgi:hypothetical protein